jgi:hypothetical protein
MADFVTVTVSGLAEFSRGLRKLDKDLPKLVRIANNKAANLLISKALPLIPRRTGRAAGSLKVASSRTEVRVRAGGPRAPYYAWLDFGGRVGRRKSVKRPFIKEGRFLYPTLAKNRAQFIAIMSEALEDVAREAGLAVE